MSKLRQHVTYSNLIATIALFLALGGTAWAALGKNAVKTKNIAPNAVTTAKIKNGAVNAAKLKNGAVTAPRLAKDAVTVNKLGRQAVTARAIAPKSILPGALALGAVQAGALATNAVVAAKIQNGNVTSNKIQAKAVTTAKFADDAVAPNSTLFDGLTSAKVMKTDRFSRTRAAAGNTVSGSATNIAVLINNNAALDFTCDGTETFTLRNTGSAPLSVWTQSDGDSTAFQSVAPGGSAAVASDIGAFDGKGWISWQIQTGTTLTTMTSTANPNGGGECAYSVFYSEVTLGSG